MSRSFFRLGGLFRGRLFVYFGLGEFASHDAAVLRAFNECRSEDLDGKPVVVETIPRVRHGVEYGFGRIVRDLNGRVLNV